jgi:V8-like Glu-specific endopeptidase
MHRPSPRAALAVLGAFALMAALPAVTYASTVGKKADKAPDEVRDYWTAERMRDAKPRERAREDRAARQKPGAAASWSTFAVDWSTAPAITRTNGKVYFTEGASNYVCSGTAVSSTNESVVWTAGHCVHGGAGGGFVRNFAFVPAYNSGTSYPTFAATSLYTTDGWPNGEYGEDVGAAVVAPASGATLTDTVGGIRIAFDTPPTINRRVDSYGYPAAGKYNGQRLYQCDSYISRTDTSTSPATMGIPCGMTGGSSGGGWIDDATGALVSVNSYGYQGLKNVMFGPQLQGAASDLYTVAETG